MAVLKAIPLETRFISSWEVSLQGFLSVGWVVLVAGLHGIVKAVTVETEMEK